MPTPAFQTPRLPATLNPATAWAAAAALILIVGWFDFFSGTELRVFPLYYAPISLLAWNVGRAGSLVAAFVSSLAWLGGNVLAGMHFSTPGVWIANTLVLAASFAVVGTLIASLKEALIRERALSRTDPLTALLNSRAFYEDGERILALCQRKQRPVAVAYLDLDNFKGVNDTLGHQAGDSLLRSVADVLGASTRPSDVCARLGGDEFVLLLAEADPEEATAAVERVRTLLSARLASVSVPVGCSLGLVAFRKAPESMEKMIRAADSLMYDAKAAGKGRLQVKVVEETS